MMTKTQGEEVKYMRNRLIKSIRGMVKKKKTVDKKIVLFIERKPVANLYFACNCLFL